MGRRIVTEEKDRDVLRSAEWKGRKPSRVAEDSRT